MTEINNTLLMQRLSAQLEALGEKGRHLSDSGGSSGGGSSDGRIGKLEASMEHVQLDIKEIKSDLRALLWAGAAAFILTWGGLLGLAVLMAKGFGWLK